MKRALALLLCLSAPAAALSADAQHFLLQLRSDHMDETQDARELAWRHRWTAVGYREVARLRVQLAKGSRSERSDAALLLGAARCGPARSALVARVPLERDHYVSWCLQAALAEAGDRPRQRAEHLDHELQRLFHPGVLADGPPEAAQLIDLIGSIHRLEAWPVLKRLNVHSDGANAEELGGLKRYVGRDLHQTP